MPVISVKVSSVIVGDRARKDMGDIAGMAASIEELGLLQPIGITPENVLIFGERRLRAAEMLGWKTIPAQVLNLSSILAGEYAENEIRKGFTLSERVGIGRGMEAELAGRQGQRTDLELPEHFPEVKGRETRELAAEKAGFGNDRTYRQAKQVVDEGAPELVAAVETGKVSVSAAADVATLPRDQQTEIVARGEKEILEAAKAIRTEKAVVRRAENDKLKAESRAIPLPAGKYRTIVIDPPWDMQKIARDVAPEQIDFDYPTMSLAQIAAFPVADMAHDEAIVFCWTTQKYLPDTFAIIEAWGFKYLAAMVWHKSGGFQPFGLPQYNCEFVLIGRKNGCEFDDTKAFNLCSQWPRREHSRKPDEFYDLVRRVSPGPRIDVFSREAREGFDQFGNQTEQFGGAA